ncbi:hypothetical protein M9434_004744 [Picochlorum sp. BPE23]|nr:hypothetical protein M9434_004744 [Picochlorum sp. BPE23]
MDGLLQYTLWWKKGEEGNVSHGDEFESCIERGEYYLAFKYAMERLLEERDDALGEDIGTAFSGVQSLVEDCRDPFVVGRVGVGALLVFMQSNVMGPFEAQQDVAESPFDMHHCDDADNAWALREIAENGEDVVGKVYLPQYLLLSKIALDALDGGVWDWWKFRVACWNQYILAERSHVLLERIDGLVARLETTYAVDEGKHYEQRALLGAVHVEAANIYTHFGMMKNVATHIDKASAALGIDARLTGALGTRTVHQKDAHAQLVLKISLDDDMKSEFDDSCGKYDGSALDENVFNMVVNKQSDVSGLDTDSDVFRNGPRLISSEDDGVLLRRDLTALHQVLLLALCNQVKKGSSPDGTQQWELAAYTEAILSQNKTEFMIRTNAYIEMARLEIARSRTRERALVTLEGIKEALSHVTSDVPMLDRLSYVFSVKMPCKAILWKELGEAFVACGLVGAAMKLFEAAELWDSLIVCYQLLQKNEIAEQLVRERLDINPSDARLWCSLGDLVDADEHYETAWECSGHRSARAQRSLARSAMRRDDFDKSRTHWKQALELSPLHLEAWFSLGWCSMKLDDHSEAIKALTRLVQMDPDDGRAWNNLATVHMKMKNWQEALVAFGEASKHSRDTWQTWENYALVACQLKDYTTSARALDHMVSLTRGDSFNISLLRNLVESLSASAEPSAAADDEENEQSNKTSPQSEEQTKSYVSKILKKIASSSKGRAKCPHRMSGEASQNAPDIHMARESGRLYYLFGSLSRALTCISCPWIEK